MKKKFWKHTLLSLLPISIIATSFIAISCSSSNPSNNPIQPNQPVDPQPPQPPIPPVVPSEEKHTLSYQNINNVQSPLSIINQTPKFKRDYNLLLRKLNGQDGGFGNKPEAADFTYNPNQQMIDEFFESIKDIGYWGDFGNTIDEKMKFAPKYEINTNFTFQKHLLNFNQDEALNAIKKDVNIDEIIANNQFGYLPSNLSQLLFYLDYESIGKIFQINNVIEIKMNFDDEKGTADILITNHDKQKYLFSYSSTDLSTTKKLKKEADFVQYIYDRSFIFSPPFQKQFKIWINPTNGKDKKVLLNDVASSGTGWVLDRIVNDPKVPPGFYEFLVATNNHVLDFSHSFNKNRSDATELHYFSDEWKPNPKFNLSVQTLAYTNEFDGGTYYKGGTNAQGADKFGWDKYIKTDPSGKQYSIPYEKFISRDFSNQALNPIQIRKPNKLNAMDAVGDAQAHPNTSNTNLDRSNIIDAVWYTPDFATTGIYSDKNIEYPLFDVDLNNIIDHDLRNSYTEWNGKYTGSTKAAGADFAITKIILSKQDVQKIFPSLYKVLDSSQEKDWYSGIGFNNQERAIAANSTLFTAGFPEQVFNYRKWNSGRILTQRRYFGIEPSSSSLSTYWTRYNETDNQKFNNHTGLVDWYKNQEFKFKSMTPEQNKQYNPKGMMVQKIIQFPILTASLDGSNDRKNILEGGASGSMVINSRFEVIGILFSYNLWDGIGSKTANNQVEIFKQYTQTNQTFSMIKQLQEKMAKEGLKSFRINPN